MSNYELMPMDINDLENWGELFSMTVRGIDDHLNNDQPDTHYVVSALLALDRQFQTLLKDVTAEWLRMAQITAKKDLEEMEQRRSAQPSQVTI